MASTKDDGTLPVAVEDLAPGLVVNVKEGDGRYRCFLILEVASDGLIASFIRHDGETDEMVFSAPRSIPFEGSAIGKLSAAAEKSGRWKVSKSQLNRELKRLQETPEEDEAEQVA